MKAKNDENSREFLDCCSSVELETVKVIFDSSHDAEYLQKCINCGTHWFYRFHEWVDYKEGNDKITSWYTKLITDEAVPAAVASNFNKYFVLASKIYSNLSFTAPPLLTFEPDPIKCCSNKVVPTVVTVGV